tara:strand:- start:370 stop:579 length:210 start_codon:yes stop_codon:yes gene_type:complete
MKTLNNIKMKTKVNKYTRASKYNGKSIYCPNCNAHNKVYHFCWSAITCGGCKEMIDKTEWNLQEQLKHK